MKSFTARLKKLLPFAASGILSFGTFYSASAIELANTPLFLVRGAEPMVMLNMSKDHQLYFKAYDDYSDVDGDGVADTTYKNSIDYYGYFDSYKCYVYQNSQFEPVAETTDKYCNSGSTTGQWSGNFLNWATMSRMDAVRKILYGGMRSTDTATDTVLERAYLPTDAHSFAKYYGGSDIAQLVGVSGSAGTTQTSGITVCNTTYHSSDLSQNVTSSPRIRVAIGNYSLWASNERWQCTWSGEHGASNGNNQTYTGVPAYSSSPASGGSNAEYRARIKVCVNGLVGTENCKTYPSGTRKPIGLLQTYGDEDQLKFGLMTGSYDKNKSGGVLRKNISAFSAEVNVATDGTFVAGAGGIVDNINKLRIYGYRHDDGTYFGSTGSDSCSWGLSSFANSNCSNWGNPQSEIYLESLRYLANRSATSAFSATDSARIAGLTAPAWSDPLNSNNYCSPISVLQFNASTSSYDGDNLSGASDIGVGDLNAKTDTIGSGENIHGNSYFIGENGTDNNQLCTAKTIANLSSVKGTCPDAPRLEGTYKIAGLAHHARTTDLRSTLTGAQTVKTYGVALAPAVPKVEIPVPTSTSGQKITILPACRNTAFTPAGNCAIVDFKILSQTTSATLNEGKLYVNWEDSEQGGDYDQDMWGIIEYSVSATQVTVKTRVVAQSTPYAMGFGYVLGGTTSDGFKVHSGINSFSMTDTGCTSASPCTSGSETTVNYPVGSSGASLLQQPLWYAAKWGGFEDANDNDLPDTAAEWDADSDSTPDTYFHANNPAELESALARAFDAVLTLDSSSSSVATNSTRLDNGTVLYQARFNSRYWTGQLLAYSVNANGSVGTVQWDASASGKIPAPNLRKVFTYNPTTGAGVPLAWSSLSSVQQLALRASGETDDVNAQRRLAWLIGDRSQESPTGTLRRRENIFGDIVNSDPMYSGALDFRYELMPQLTNGMATLGRDTYEAYVTTKKARTPVLYVGANDGFVHAINANNGAEIFAYMPSGAFANAIKLTRPDYGMNANPHQYFADGPLFVGDAYIGGAWKTILVGSMGAGGKTFFALDVSDPDSFDETKVLFELNASDADLGNVLGQPLVVRMADGRWAAVFGNGYNSTNGQAKLFIVDLANPASIVKVVTDGSGSNGMAGATLLNSSGTVQYAYVGDLLGNLWKFDLTDTSTSGGLNWESAYKSGSAPRPLFKTARRTTGADTVSRQPITSAPVLGRNSEKNNNIMVYFGTGRYFATNDNVVGSDPMVQSVYGILDDGAITTDTTFANRGTITLRQKTISAQTSAARTITEGTVNWSSSSTKGWYLDLINPSSTTGSGERVISKPLLLFDRLLFTTVIPSQNPCEFGGSGWLMELGGVSDDTSTFRLLSSDALYLEHAVLKLSSFIKGGSSGYLPTSNTRGQPNTYETNIPPGSGGRQSWRQLK